MVATVDKVLSILDLINQVIAKNNRIRSLRIRIYGEFSPNMSKKYLHNLAVIARLWKYYNNQIN